MAIRVQASPVMRSVLVLAFGLSLAGQEPRFDARSRLVLVPVSVTDRGGPSGGGSGSLRIYAAR